MESRRRKFETAPLVTSKRYWIAVPSSELLPMGESFNL